MCVCARNDKTYIFNILTKTIFSDRVGRRTAYARAYVNMVVERRKPFVRRNEFVSRISKTVTILSASRGIKKKKTRALDRKITQPSGALFPTV